MLLTMVTMMASCIKDSNTEVTLYNDAAITAFSLGTLSKTTYTTASDGTDSLITTSFDGKSFTFSIDQVNRMIFNRDSLPLGTNVTKVVCNLSTRNNGVACYVDKEDKDKYYYYNSGDSIDFSTPREFLVYASDGNGSTKYIIKINVHQQEGNEFIWHRVGTDYNPTTPSLPQGIKKIIGECLTETYALSDDNKLMVSTDGQITWQEETLNSDASLLPTEDVTIAAYPIPLADNTFRVVLAGNRNTENYPNDSHAMIWQKIVDFDYGAPKSSWVYVERGSETSYLLPNLGSLNIVKYDDGILAFGKPYDKIYQSRDNGITWKSNSVYHMPEGFNTTATAIKVKVDDNNNIWIYCEGTGEIWQGHLNRLTWENNN